MISMADLRSKLLDERVNDVKQFHVKRSRPVLVGWSDQDFDNLKQWRLVERRPVREVAKMLGRSYPSVRKQLHEQGWVAPYHKHKPVDWATLDAKLRALHAQGFWVDDIAKELKLHWRQVQSRGYRLGLSWRGQGARV